jgi:hypothetical protein
MIDNKIMRIGILIPCTSKDRDWLKMRDTYLFQYTLKTFLATSCPGHEYIFYIGYDKEDRVFSKPFEQNYLRIFEKVYPVHFQFVELDEPPGYLTRMWNKLFQIAYDEECDYFFQCGDDILFKTRRWITDSIEVLESHGDIGITGPDNKTRILTQAFVSRKHMEIFGKFFPESIINWGCDDWYNWVYEDYLYPLYGHVCMNEGGRPRYVINHDEFFDEDRTRSLRELRDQVFRIAIRDREKIEKYLNLSIEKSHNHV